MYRKEIIYMSLYNGDIKEGCVGYLKSEERQGKIGLELQVKNISGAVTGNYPIRLQNAMGWQEEGSLALKDGSGKWTGNTTEPIMRAEIIISDLTIIKGCSRNAPIEEMKGISYPAADEDIKFAGDKAESQAVLETEKKVQKVQTVAESEGKEPKVQDAAEPKEKEAKVKDASESEGKESKSQATVESEEKKFRAQTVIKPDRYASAINDRKESPDSVLRAQDRAARNTSINITPAVTDSAPIYESKWEQLLATYEQIHPYGDSRVYVKLEPKDFVILPSGYQHLVNNSFLLHGFYNYRYLILGKEKDFYIGVPGVFYEREKMVALMFGFEAFECEGGNAQEGKFGYYLRKVEL